MRGHLKVHVRAQSGTNKYLRNDKLLRDFYYKEF